MIRVAGERGVQGAVGNLAGLTPSFQIPGARPYWGMPILPGERGEDVPRVLIPRQGPEAFPLPQGRPGLPQAMGGMAPMGNAGSFYNPPYVQQQALIGIGGKTVS